MFRDGLSTYVHFNERSEASYHWCAEALSDTELSIRLLLLSQSGRAECLPQVLLDPQAKLQAVWTGLFRGRADHGVQHRVVDGLVLLYGVTMDQQRDGALLQRCLPLPPLCSLNHEEQQEDSTPVH